MNPNARGFGYGEDETYMYLLPTLSIINTNFTFHLDQGNRQNLAMVLVKMESWPTSFMAFENVFIIKHVNNDSIFTQIAVFNLLVQHI